MLSDLTPSQLELANYMSAISEVAYCAAWMDDLEFALWQLIVAGPFAYGQLELNSENRMRLIELSGACAGWVTFHDQLGESFVPMDEWLQLVQAKGRMGGAA